MSIRPPSLQKARDDYWSGDPAFVQPPKDADEKELAAHAERWRIARETNGWESLALVEGDKPTKFIMRQLPGHVFRAITDKFLSGVCGATSLPALMFRAALRGVEGLEIDGWNGHIAWSSAYGIDGLADNVVPDALDAHDISIVAELGREVGRRAQTIAPKL